MLQKLILLPESSIKIHILVILIFLTMTCIMTFPVIANFDTEFAGVGDLPQGRDVPHSIWKIWWYDYSLKNDLDPLHTNFIFYPDGTNVLTHNSFAIIIGLALKQVFSYTVTWNILFFIGYVFGGYSCFLLAYHFQKNFLASIIAGAIFTFGTFHTNQSELHIGLATIFWLPLSILFLFKISESPTKFNAIIGGILLFFVFFTHIYFALIMIIFVIVFFVVFLFKLEKKNRRKFLTYYLMAVGIFIILSVPLVYPILASFDSSSAFERQIDEHVRYSLSLQNLFLAAPHQSFNDLNHGIALALESSLDFPLSKDLQTEQIVYIGFSSIILSLIAVFKFRSKFVYFWVLIFVVFTILSLGPELKIFEDSTEIPMPSKILFEIPGWDFFRAEARFIVMASLATAILSSITISRINEKYLKTKRKFWIVGGVVLFLIMLEFTTIPFPTSQLNIPSIYEEIKNDPRQIAILESPIGGAGEFYLFSDPIYQYYQIIHEKPIIGGFESRPPFEILRNLQMYFLDKFLWYNSIGTIVKQDLEKVGISIFEYHNIGYVIVHKDLDYYFSKEDVRDLLPKLKQTLNEILHVQKPDFEDRTLFMYKIPQSTSSQTFIILDSGWSILGESHVGFFRDISPGATIHLVNPTDSTIFRNLEIDLRSLSEPHTLSVLLNNNDLKFVEELKIPLDGIRVKMTDLELKPGINVLTLNSDGYSIEISYTDIEEDRKIAFRVYSVTLNQ